MAWEGARDAKKLTRALLSQKTEGEPMMNVDNPTDATDVPNWAEAQERFAQILGVKGQLPEAVLRRAVVDSNFAYRLLVSRNAPSFMNVLINDPGNASYAPPPEPIEPAKPTEHKLSNLALLGKAAKSLVAWGAAGFSHVDKAVHARRLTACQACPHLQEPPDLLAYRVIGAAKNERAVCGQCGCVVRNKALMSTESCPDEHPEMPGFTRWQEPLKT